MSDLVREIEETAAAERKKEEIEPLGAEQVQAQEPETRPETLDKSPAPFIHAATKPLKVALPIFCRKNYPEALFPSSSLLEERHPRRG